MIAAESSRISDKDKAPGCNHTGAQQGRGDLAQRLKAGRAKTAASSSRDAPSGLPIAIVDTLRKADRQKAMSKIQSCVQDKRRAYSSEKQPDARTIPGMRPARRQNPSAR